MNPPIAIFDDNTVWTRNLCQSFVLLILLGSGCSTASASYTFYAVQRHALSLDLYLGSYTVILGAPRAHLLSRRCCCVCACVCDCIILSTATPTPTAAQFCQMPCPCPWPWPWAWTWYRNLLTFRHNFRVRRILLHLLVRRWTILVSIHYLVLVLWLWPVLCRLEALALALPSRLAPY